MIGMNLSVIVSWLNANQGVLSLAVFTATIMFGWLSGIFASLRRKPKLRIESIDGPTFVCTFGTGNKHEGYDAHQTGIALYLRITNVGSAPTSIEHVAVGYRWAISKSSKLWWKYGLLRFWIDQQTVAISDFQAALGTESVKIFPFLTQANALSGRSSDTYLEVGKSTNGVVYFEQLESFGACFPVSINNSVNLKIIITDVYGKKHRTKIEVPKVNLAEARKYNPNFGQTLSTIHSQPDGFDLPTDHHGNLIPPDDQQGIVNSKT